jgi:hypothetical protein
MRIRAGLAIVAVSLAVSGCATRGAVRITCNDFGRYVTPIEPSRIVKDIQQDSGQPVHVLSPFDAVGTDKTAARLSPLGESLKALTLDNAVKLRTTKARETARGAPAVLLLSGGGQWGAFGAGFLSALHRQGGERAIDFGVITGVSTGGLQSLFVAVDHVDDEAYKKLERSYSPVREKEIVNRNGKPLAVVTGSLAGLKPLRRKIEAALCTDGNPARGCPMIDKLAASGRQVYIGFVKADTGVFEYADAVKIASSGTGSLEARKNAQQCLTGIALASAAMPVFFQQVRINGSTFYDGGVRQSVFEQNVANELAQAVEVARTKLQPDGIRASSREVPSPILYVVRNGPTQLLGTKGKPENDITANRKADALTAAFRAEAIVVNQLEVGSIAALRLAHPVGPIRLVTADGYHKWLTPAGSEVAAGCSKPPNIMFDPEFMRCLQRFGQSKAGRPVPWIELSPLQLPQSATVADTVSGTEKGP